jgi:hypothetical protein
MPQLDLYRACDEIFFAFLLFLIIYFLTIYKVIPLVIKRQSIIEIQKKRQKYKKLNIAVYYTLNKLSKDKQKYIIKV